MRKVEFRKFTPPQYKDNERYFENLLPNTGCYSEDFDQRGLLLHWGTKEGTTVGIVEMPDKSIRIVDVSVMRFVD